MMNKKDLVIVALATFCLTATLFTILPSKSGIPYDPWADVSGPTQGVPDGTINMRDINYEIQHFNQDVSNITRNVNVTNLPQPYRVDSYLGINVSWTDFGASYSWWTHELDVTPVQGYSRLSIQMIIRDWIPGSGSTTFAAEIYWRNMDPSVPEMGMIDVHKALDYDNVSISFPHDVAPPFSCLSRIMETQAAYYEIRPSMGIGSSEVQNGWVILDFYVYLRNE